MEDDVGLEKQVAEVAAGEVQRDELELLPTARKIEVAELLAATIVVVEAVDADHAHAIGQKRLGELRADETCASGDQRGPGGAQRRSPGAMSLPLVHLSTPIRASYTQQERRAQPSTSDSS